MATVEQQLNREREARFTSMQRLRAAEDEAASLTSQLDALTEELSTAKKANKEGERKFALAQQSKALESLQAELREEVIKSAALAQELSVLKELAESGSGEMQERVNYVERERTRDRLRLEGQLSGQKNNVFIHFFF